MRRSKLFGICFLCILFISFASLAGAVSTMEELQTALTNEEPEITLEAGTYYGNLEIDYSVTLTGEDGVIMISSPDFEGMEYAQDIPLVQVYNESDEELAVSISNIEFTTSADDYTSIAVVAGANVDLTLTDCVIDGDFRAGVVITNLDDIFQTLGYTSTYYLDAEEMPDGTPTTPANLTMQGCTLQNYNYAGVAILGQGVTADISSNDVLGELEHTVNGIVEDLQSGSFTASEAVNGALSGYLGSLASLDTFRASYVDEEEEEVIGAAGILIANGVEDEVRIYDGNGISGNYFGVLTAKNIFMDLSGFETQETTASEAEAGSGLSLEAENTICNNLVGVTAVGGLEATLLAWPSSSDVYMLLSDDISLNNTPLDLYVAEQNINNNVIGALMAGNVNMIFQDNVLSGDLVAGLIGLGDFSDSSIEGNTFNGITGAAMVFALQKANITEMIEVGSSLLRYMNTDYDDDMVINQQRTLTVFNNTITGNGPIEGVHDRIDDLSGLTPKTVLGEATALGQRTADSGPLAILPSPVELDDDDDDEEIGPDDISIAGIVLLDGARKISIEENTINGTLLGITAIDTGIVENIQEIDITGNTVEGNICGLTLVGAGQILVPLAEAKLEEDLNLEENLNSEAFLSADNKLVLGEVSGNHFDKNHIGMISALSVEGEIHNNYFDDNALLGMVHIGIGDWVLGLTGYVMGYGSTEEIIGDIYPELSIKRNNITGNGINPENGPAFLNEVISDDIKYKDMLCGGILVIDCAKTDGLTINENNIAGNGSYGIITTTRKSYTEYPFAYEAKETTESEILDATSNWWGDPSGPGSYAPGSQTAPGYSDPVTKTIANGSGDPIGTFLVGIDGVYVPYSISASESSDPEVEVLFFSPEENIINFSKYSSTEFPIEPVSSSGGGSCGVASFTPSLLLLLAPLAFMLRRK